MDEFIAKHKSFLLSSLYLVTCLLALGYATLYTPASVYSNDIVVAISSIEKSSGVMTKKLAQLSEKKEEGNEIGIHYLPIFLIRINEIAHNNDVIIRKLTPSDEQKLKFQMDFIATYGVLIQFIAELETLDVILDDIQVHPYDSGSVPPKHAVSFTIIPRNDARAITENVRIQKMREEVQKDKRDPFQRFAYDANLKRVRPSIDLTWIYKLGSLGTGQDGKQYVTIDRKQYRIGDKLDGRTIEDILDDRVDFFKETSEGKLKYSLSFRKKDKKK